MNGLLEQNTIVVENEPVVFNDSFGFRARAPDRQGFGLGRATKSFYRTDRTLRFARQTNERAKIDKRGIEIGGAAYRHDLGSATPEELPAGGGIDCDPHIKEARENTRGVRLDYGNGLVEGEARDRVGGVFSDAGELPDRSDVAREFSIMSILDEPGGGVQVAGASVVAKSLPGVEDIVLRSACQRGEVGEAPEPGVIIRAHGSDCCLLQHELGDEDGVRVAGVAPRQVASVAAIPGEETATESADAGWREHDLAANVERSTSNVQRSIQKKIEP